VKQTIRGESAGRFLASLPTPPSGCRGKYKYSGDGSAFTLTYEPVGGDRRLLCLEFEVKG
jgi:hypothetical protein